MTHDPFDDDLALTDDGPSAVGPSHGGEGGVALIITAGRPRLVLTGEIDVSLVADFTDAADEALRHRGPVEVDARGVTFMDSSGVSMLARLAMLAPERVTVLDPPPMVRLLLEVTQVDQVLDLATSQDDGAPVEAGGTSQGVAGPGATR